ncbi:PAS domain-containing protein [Gordonia desulfuricans]|uniref:histidine kinase n=1 Tax=Gordonia desulfuricans TaxID=89051 RepID=A0A7K3LPA7_9ACTN|nr:MULTISPECIES: ATP-binding protein [Gordonia]EMP14359.1 histidine kinase [Gordonia sp. NB41Y]NDK90069.1 PAS domain-containing protein [Gordonia desulfuricans]WLP92163.1 ATP-binding protein [Gordonia sp. NB41Y]
MTDVVPCAALTADDHLALLEAGDTCILLHDAESLQIVWANPAACRMLEVELAELLQLRANHISKPAREYDRVVARALLNQALDRGAARVEWHLRSKSGRVFRCDAFATRVELSQGPAVMVQYRDIERELSTERAERLTETHVGMLTQHTSTIALTVAQDGSIQAATDTALGYLFPDRTTVSPIGRTLMSCTQIRVNGQPSTWSEVVAATSPLHPLQLLIDRDGTPIWLEGSVERLPELAAQRYLIILHDITDRIREEEVRELALHQENYLARYNAMGDMAMAIAHELGQPLAAADNFITGVRGFSRSLAGTERLDADTCSDIDSGLELASKQIARAATIVNTVRAYVGHLEHVEQVVDLNDVVRECLPFMQLRSGPTGVPIEVRLSEQPVWVRCERVLVGQVMLNLCFNAVDEMVACGDTATPVVITTSNTGGEGIFTVDDQGRGLNRDPFHESFTEKAHGSGIGLALSYRIITRQHGTIWNRPRAGGGTVFGFGLPSQ